MRATLILVACLMLAHPPAFAQQEVPILPPIDSYTAAGLTDWQRNFKTRALAQGIPEQVFDLAFRDVQLLPDVIDKDRRQDEFTRTIWDYLDRAVSDDRIASGRKALKHNAEILGQIEDRFGVGL